MKKAFVKALELEAAQNKKLILLTADHGYGLFDAFMKNYPKQFLNVGVAEQNMITVAAGLASTGHVVFAFSLGNFATLRCLEQIRSVVCLGGYDVKIVAVGGGFEYGQLASTHHMTEDLAIMRSLPNLSVVAPGDRAETALATQDSARNGTPVYLRLSREEWEHALSSEFQMGKASVLLKGNDLTLIATGGMLRTTLEAANLLQSSSIQCTVLSMHTLKPLDEETVKMCARETKKIITIEEHTVIGGLGSAVADVLAEAHLTDTRFHKIGIPDTFMHTIGSRDYLREKVNLTPEGIASCAREMCV